MVRTCTTGSDDQTPAPLARAVRGRGRGRRGARGVAIAPTQTTTEEPPVAPVGGQAPQAPIATPTPQETLVLFMSMFDTFTQAGLIPLASATSQAGGVAQTLAACTLEQQRVVRAATSEKEQHRLERFKKYHPPTFSGLASEDVHRFLEECHCILRTMDIVEMSGVAFTTFQLKKAAYQWWRAYKVGNPSEAASLTWDQFLEIFLREFVPQTLRDTWRVEFEELHRSTMTVSEYAV
ncbi:uncharacterized protein [Nicotiana tomentosiformis]|uniref:uncharacterized protein n=1 Tax=Nicotiana tomentosiformis TaxID=4098 RepID=UPI00388C6B6B